MAHIYIRGNLVVIDIRLRCEGTFPCSPTPRLLDCLMYRTKTKASKTPRAFGAASAVARPGVVLWRAPAKPGPAISTAPVQPGRRSVCVAALAHGRLAQAPETSGTKQARAVPPPCRICGSGSAAVALRWLRVSARGDTHSRICHHPAAFISRLTPG